MTHSLLIPIDAEGNLHPEFGFGFGLLKQVVVVPYLCLSLNWLWWRNALFGEVWTCRSASRRGACGRRVRPGVYRRPPVDACAGRPSALSAAFGASVSLLCSGRPDSASADAAPVTGAPPRSAPPCGQRIPCGPRHAIRLPDTASGSREPLAVYSRPHSVVRFPRSSVILFPCPSMRR